MSHQRYIDEMYQWGREEYVDAAQQIREDHPEIKVPWIEPADAWGHFKWEELFDGKNYDADLKMAEAWVKGYWDAAYDAAPTEELQKKVPIKLVKSLKAVWGLAERARKGQEIWPSEGHGLTCDIPPKKNPLWPGKKHPDLFGGDTGIAVREDDPEEMEQYEQDLEVLDEKLEPMIDYIVELIDKWDAGRQEGFDQDDAGDESSHLFEGLFEPWLEDGGHSEVLEKIREGKLGQDVQTKVEELEAAGVTDDQIEELLKQVNFYEGHTGSHTYWPNPEWVYHINDDENTDEWDEWGREHEKHFEEMDELIQQYLPDQDDQIEKWKDIVNEVNRRINGGHWEGPDWQGFDKSHDSWQYRNRWGGAEVWSQYSFYVTFDDGAFIEAADELLAERGPKEAQTYAEADLTGHRIVYDFPKPFEDFVCIALKPGDLKQEGSKLGICVGQERMGYASALRSGEIEIWSIRTRAGKPKFTIEVDKHHKSHPEQEESFAKVAQVKGKANRKPGFDPGKDDEPGASFKRDEAVMVINMFRDLGFDTSKIHDLQPALKRLGETSRTNPRSNPNHERSFDEPYRRS